MLQLVDSQGTTVFTNDNWQDSQAAEIASTGLAPTNPLEASLVFRPRPGSYAALLLDTHGASGIGLLEIYNVTSNSSRKEKVIRLLPLR